MVLAAPAGVPRAALADASARGERVLAYVTGLTAVHAAALFIAGVDGFATRLAELPHAATGVIDRRLHLEPMSALAVLHLARSVRDPAFDPLAAATRACAAGSYVHRRSNGGFSHFCHRRSSRHTAFINCKTRVRDESNGKTTQDLVEHNLGCRRGGSVCFVGITVGM
jgi:hypothetical protein